VAEQPQQLPAPLVLNIPPGIRRDGGFIEGDFTCVDGRWCRFDRGKPRKMNGYQKLVTLANGPYQTMLASDKTAGPGIYLGSIEALDYVRLQGTTPTAPIDRTPAAYTADARTLWQFDQIYQPSGSASLIIAHPGLNLADIAQTEDSPLYYASNNDTSQFAPLSPSDGVNTLTGVSGGVVILHPYAFYYGNDGYATWSVPGEPNDLTVADGGGGFAGARICESKVVRGLPYRGGPGNAPAGLFWSLNALVRATFVGSTNVFNFDTISNDITVLSSSAILEYDGAFYWVGTDRFYFYNGVVRDWPNLLNKDFFWDNLNRAYAQKVYMFKVPRRGEIWICFPRGQSTFCNWAIIFNVLNNSWYDTELPTYGRSAGVAAQVLGYPYMVAAEDATPDAATASYGLWQHETGLDEVDGSTLNAIYSYFTTGNLSRTDQQSNKALQVQMVEPDFVQTGTLNLFIEGRANARAPNVETGPFPFDEATQAVHPKTARRFLQFKVESNEVGGSYLMGTPIAHLRDTGGRSTTS